MGTTLFKDAKTPDDYAQVESQFKQAVDLAPQWPDARYNLALSEEAAGDYSGAMADLKLYQQFKLSDPEARTVQDKIYALEAKQIKTVSDNSTKETKATSDAEEAKFGWLQAEWSYESEHGNWGPNYGAATGSARAQRTGNTVDIGPINSYDGPWGSLRAIVGGSGVLSWDFIYSVNYGGCDRGKDVPAAVKIGEDRRTIRFQVDNWSGSACKSNFPFIVTMTRR